MNKFTKYKVVNSLATVDFHKFPRKYKAMDTNWIESSACRTTDTVKERYYVEIGNWYY